MLLNNNFKKLFVQDMGDVEGRHAWGHGPGANFSDDRAGNTKCYRRIIEKAKIT
jgi:hypothetical protein